MSQEEIQSLVDMTYKIGTYSFNPNTNPTQYVAITPYIVATKIYSDGESKIVVSILSDGTIHVDPAAFELMMEKQVRQRFEKALTEMSSGRIGLRDIKEVKMYRDGRGILSL